SLLVDVDTKKTIEQILDFEVREPKTPDDAAVFEILKKDPELAGAIMKPVDAPDEKVVEKLDRLLADHPRSTYADYARFRVARHCIRSKKDEDQTWAVKHLRRLVDRDFAYRPNAIIALMKTGPDDYEELKDLMNREYFDSIEWLEFVAKDMTADEWKAFR